MIYGLNSDDQEFAKGARQMILAWQEVPNADDFGLTGAKSTSLPKSSTNSLRWDLRSSAATLSYIFFVFIPPKRPRASAA